MATGFSAFSNRGSFPGETGAPVRRAWRRLMQQTMSSTAPRDTTIQAHVVCLTWLWHIFAHNTAIGGQIFEKWEVNLGTMSSHCDASPLLLAAETVLAAREPGLTHRQVGEAPPPQRRPQ